jgi:H+/Cl- antiporter ClcA
LLGLEKVTQIRTANFWIIGFLPLGGFVIGLLYHYYGKSVVKGNNLILEEYDTPRQTIPFRMAPLVLITTLLTHLFGGSARREGTAVQMGAAISDGMQRWFKWAVIDRNTMLVLGISAGFASVFGTPVAGALFAMEVLSFKKITFKTVLLSFAVAFIAHYTVELWPVIHTHYTIPIVPDFSLAAAFWTVFASVIFGLAALLFSRSTHFWGDLFNKTITYAPFRPLVGGCVLALVLFNFSVQPYIGLGVPVIVDAFSTANPWYAFLLKILLTYPFYQYN